MPPELARKIREEEEFRSQGIRVNVVRPVIWQGKKVWALGNRIYPGRRPNETFHEFIIDVLRNELGREWWEAQLALPESRQHFIMQCFQHLSDWQRRHAPDANREADGVWSALPDGWSRSLVAFAWDVASLLHAAKIPAQLLDRLRSMPEFQGARHELAIDAVFARLGFRIEFLDDGPKHTEKHCEFYAHCENPPFSIAVEAKSRRRAGVLHEAGEEDPARAQEGRGVVRLLKSAVEQRPGDRPFVVFVDVNAPQTPGLPFREKQWVRDIQSIIEGLEPPSPQKRCPYNAVFFTNYPYHYQASNEAKPGEYLMEVPHYVEHPLPEPRVMDWLVAALNNYGNVPDIRPD